MDAQRSIAVSLEALGDRLGINVPDLPTHRDPSVRDLFIIESLDSSLKEIVAALERAEPQVKNVRKRIERISKRSSEATGVDADDETED